MRWFFILSMFVLIGCQEQKTPVSVVAPVSSSAVDPFAKPGDPGCADSELTEQKIVEKAMEKPKVDTSAGALKGATDCEVE